MVSSMRTCHCHSSGDGSPKCESRGGRRKEGRLHPCLPLQCGGCCCSEASPGKTFPFIIRQIFHKRPRQDHCGCEGEWLSWFTLECAMNGPRFCSRRSRAGCVSPCG